MKRKGILVVAVMVVVWGAGCGSNALVTGCLSQTACVSSAADCAMGERCNTAVSPPRCQQLFCGAEGTECGGDGADALCVSQRCVASRCAPMGVSDLGTASGDLAGVDQSMTSGSIVPKTGMYTGARLDPNLNTVADCSDSPLEPNDTPSSAVTGLDGNLNLVVDANSPKLQMLAICPTGPNPKAGGHDVDYYEINPTQAVSATVEIFYDVKYGDLDVGIFRADGSLVASDGTAVSNGCVASSLPAGTYYVGVGGANGIDSNRYEMRIRYYSTPHTCP